MENTKLQKTNKYLLIIFILIQPFFNIIRENIINDIQIFGLSFFEIVNVIIVFSSFTITLILNLKNKKFIKTISVFFSVFLLYFIIHSFNIMNFNLFVYENASPSFLVETYHLIISFVIPSLYCILLIFSNITKKEMLNVLKTLVFIITNIVVLCNIFSIASTAYQTKLDHAYSIFNWINFENTSYYAYYALTSKGLFSSANQLSAILFVVAPIIMYSVYVNRKKFDYYLLFMISLTMLMLGTKTASIGILLIYIMFICFWIVLRLLKKENMNIKSIFVLFIITIFIFCFSPFSYNIRYRLFKGNAMTNFEIIQGNSSVQNEDEIKILEEYNELKKLTCKDLDEKQSKKINDFFEKNLNIIGISEYIVRSYPVKNHVCFWHNYLTNNGTNDYRVVKTSILKNIYDENNNKYDKFLGMGHTLNFLYTEEDYSYQFYSYGIIGIIVLFGTYVAYIIYCISNITKNYKNKFNLENLISISGPILIFGIAYFSGHVLERILPLTVLAFVIAYNVKEKVNNNNKKVLFISSTGGHLSELLELKSLFNKFESYLITEKTKSTINLKNKFDNVDYLVYGTKEHRFSYLFKFSYNSFKSLILFIKIRPKVIITTGTHTAVPMCYIGKLFGSKIIFIETFANSKTKTLSGKLVYPICDTFIVQWESMLKLYPKAKCGGWIY